MLETWGAKRFWFGVSLGNRSTPDVGSRPGGPPPTTAAWRRPRAALTAKRPINLRAVPRQSGAVTDAVRMRPGADGGWAANFHGHRFRRKVVTMSLAEFNPEHEPGMPNRQLAEVRP